MLTRALNLSERLNFPENLIWKAVNDTRIFTATDETWVAHSLPIGNLILLANDKPVCKDDKAESSKKTKRYFADMKPG